MESGWAELPEELLTKVLQAAEPCAPQDGGWVGGLLGDGAATSGWKCRHDALVMWLLLRQDACHRRGHRPLGGTRHMTVEYLSVNEFAFASPPCHSLRRSRAAHRSAPRGSSLRCLRRRLLAEERQDAAAAHGGLLAQQRTHAGRGGSTLQYNHQQGFQTGFNRNPLRCIRVSIGSLNSIWQSPGATASASQCTFGALASWRK
jgi:hypothetical protein